MTPPLRLALIGLGKIAHASGIQIDAVAICTPPQVRRTIAQVVIAQN